MYFVIKTLVTALVVAGVSELAKRYSLLASILATLPIISILTFIWVYIETKDAAKVTALCEGIAWFILPSLVFFIAFPWLIKKNYGFWEAMALGMIPLAVSFVLAMYLKKLIDG